MVFSSSGISEVPNISLLAYVLDGPEYDQDRIIYIDALDESRRMTALEARSSIRRVVSGLKAHGVEKGDTILVHSFSDIIYPILYLGIIGAGAVFVGSNPSNTPQELTHLLTLASVRYIIAAPSHLDSLLQITNTLPNPVLNSRIFIFDTPHDPTIPSGFQSWKTLLQHGELSWEEFQDEKLSQTTTVAFYATSGTTGLPKVAELSHRAAIARCIAAHDPNPKPYNVLRLLALPMFHCISLTLTHMDPLRFGIPTYIMPRLELAAFQAAVHNFGITETALVPTVIRMLLEAQPKDSLRRGLGSLRLIKCSGAPLDVDLQQRFEEVLHRDALVINFWGSTEYSTVTCFTNERDSTGSCGRLVVNTEAIIVDADRQEIVVDSTPGEVLIRGPCLISRYFRDEKATADAFANGWLRTGDIGYHKDGKWYIVDRAKDMMKVRGWQVSPAELEATLRQHPQVSDVAVIGIRAADWDGELPRAYVLRKQLSPGEVVVTEDELKGFLLSRLAKYKALDGGVRFVHVIPKTQTGKALKRVMRAEAERELANVGL